MCCISVLLQLVSSLSFYCLFFLWCFLRVIKEEDKCSGHSHLSPVALIGKHLGCAVETKSLSEEGRVEVND